MKKTLLGLAATGVLTVMAGAVLAQNAQTRPLKGDAVGDARISQTEFVEARVARLTAVDANRDGAVSAEERRSGVDTRRNQRASSRFERLDTDGNGALSREEFASARERREPRGARAARPPMAIAEARSRTTDAFARLDTDGDGYLTREERLAARETMREARRERRAQRMAATPSPAMAHSE